MDIEKIITDLFVFAVTMGIGWYMRTIKVKLNHVIVQVNHLVNTVTTLDTTVKGHTLTVTELTLCNSVMSRIGIKIQQALEYIDRDDKVIQSFIIAQGEAAKEGIQWAIRNNLKVSEKEVLAKFELMTRSIRDLLVDTPPEFSTRVRPFLKDIAEHHIRRVVAITQDDLFNSKLDRFFTLTEQTVNEILTTIVRTRIENKL